MKLLKRILAIVQFVLVIIFSPQLVHNINILMGMSINIVDGVSALQIGFLWTLSMGVLLVFVLDL